jgi:hypothetical protein
MKNIIVSGPLEHRYPPIIRREELSSLKMIFCGTIRGPLLAMSRSTSIKEIWMRLNRQISKSLR